MKTNLTLRRAMIPLAVFLGFLNVQASRIEAQSIRKHHKNMTASEKADYVAALYALGGPGGPSGASGQVLAYATLHDSGMCEMHRRLEFLPWHRLFIRDFEGLVQNLYPDLSLPYWDWLDHNIQSLVQPWPDADRDALWKNAFLGQFNTPWKLDRWMDCTRNCPPTSPTGGPIVSMPTAGEVAAAMALTDFAAFAGSEATSSWQTQCETGGMANAPDTYQGQLEKEHDKPHGWVGGEMQTGFSPLDPSFYLHHANVDRLWQQWEDANQTSSFPDPASFPLPNYPSVDANTIVDSRSLDIWYSVKVGPNYPYGNATYEVVLDHHTVFTDGPKRYLNTTGNVVARDDFVVPAAASCVFETRPGKRIVMAPGFSVEAGASFSAIIRDFPAGSSPPVNPTLDYAAMKNQEGADSPAVSRNPSLRATPNPFNPRTVVRYRLSSRERVDLKIYDVRGRIVRSLVTNEMQLPGLYAVPWSGQGDDGAALASGIYFGRLIVGNEIYFIKLALIK